MSDAAFYILVALLAASLTALALFHLALINNDSEDDGA